jgi:4-carboxymuconolactone decarboxylase
MTRLRPLTPDTLQDDQIQLYQEITSGPRAQGRQLFRLTGDGGQLLGPFNAMLLRPAIGRQLQALGAAIRYRGELSDRAREIAILAVAAHWKSAFEQYAHEPMARDAGLPDPVIAAIRVQGPVNLDDPEEQAVLELTRTLVTGADLNDAGYAGAEAVLGEATIFEVTTLVGYYSTLALQMRVFHADNAPPTPTATDDRRS